MNFMSSGRGFYEDGSKGNWLEKQEEQEDESSRLRCYLGGGGGGGGSEQPDLTMDSSSSPSNPVGGEEVGHVGGGSSSGEVQVIEREHMFDKVVTPSDVGKLNRLVIPKQHAEKYFPLDSSSNEKGLLLNFEDRNGKPWRFRYSYWNSSQSYVMTKGWSRFVKEKKLDAGDIVSFQRGVGDYAKDRLFIDWRRRPDAPDLPPPIPAFSLPSHFSFRPGDHHHYHPHPSLFMHSRERHQLYAFGPHQSHLNSGYGFGNSSGSVLYLKSPSPVQQLGVVQLPRGGGGGGGGVDHHHHHHHHQGMPLHHQQQHHHPMVFDSVPVVQGKAAAKRLRLFGVNMECPVSESSEECDILSSTTISTPPPPQPPSSYPLLPFRPDESMDKGKSSMSLDLDI